MTKSSAKELRTKRAYNDRPEMRRRNALQKKAWRAAVKAGKIKPGDGKSVEHKKSLDKGGENKRENISIVSLKRNKGWRGKKGSGSAKWG